MTEKREYREILEREGFTVVEKPVKQRTLTGSITVHETTSGSIEGKRGAARIDIVVRPEGGEVTAIAHLSSGLQANALAERLEDLGGIVDVDENRVAAKFRNVDRETVASIARETARAVRAG